KPDPTPDPTPDPKPDPKPDPTPDPKPDPKPDPTPTPETPVATNKQNQAGARQSNPSVTEKKKYGGFLPKTATETETLALYGLLFVGLSSSGWYIYKRRNKAS
ncbi:TPA: LPXTG cell wall anchor domain-containing protein, partial [Enterococcus faecalis]